MTWGRAAVEAVGLAVAFFVLYGGTNYVTSLRSDVGVWVYEWERGMPFAAWAIVPYMLIDAFFIGAPFACRTVGELRVLRWRILMALGVAAGFFLAMPLRFSFERPAVPGVLGWVFETFLKMDKPFNEFPSLHVALSVILAAHYGPMLAKWVWLRVASGLWYLLIVASTLLTYQHHDRRGRGVCAGVDLHLRGRAGAVGGGGDAEREGGGVLRGGGGVDGVVGVVPGAGGVRVALAGGGVRDDRGGVFLAGVGGVPEGGGAVAGGGRGC